MKECSVCGKRIGPNVFTDLWATPRPRTHRWGCAELIKQLESKFGCFDAFFGKTDGVSGFAIDCNLSVEPTLLADWCHLPFKDSVFPFGFWDPPYDHLYRPELKEICRVCQRLALLHEYVQPIIKGWKRQVVLGITMGPNKRIRCLQVWSKI